MASMCASCPFREGGDIELRNRVMERTIFQASQICHHPRTHGRKETHLCRAPLPAPAASRPRTTHSPAKPRPSVPQGNGAVSLNGPEGRILNAMAKLRAATIYPCPRVQVALLANYSNQASTGFAKGISSLSSRGLIRYPSSGYVEFTKEAEGIVDISDAPATNDELHGRIFELMPGPESRLLRPLIERFPKQMDRQELAAKSGYGNTASTGFAKAISRLSSLGLIEYPERGMVRAKDLLFPEGK